jgi:putative sterol carrier protein
MLAVLAKAVERYTLNRGGANQAFLRVLMPVNMREEQEKADYGNRISVLPVDIPFNIADPLQHLTAVTRYTQVMKESSLAYSMDLVLTLPSLMPAPLQPAIWNIAPTAFSLLAHTWCTNVAAMPTPVYLLGHQLKHVYGFFPLNPSMGLACVIVSYNGRITMSLVLDKGIVVGIAELEQHMKDAYSGLKRAANVPNLDDMRVTEKPMMVPAPALVHASVNGEAPSSNGDGSKSDTLIAQAVPVVPDGKELVSSNGSSSVITPVEAPIENQVQETAIKLFSEEWAKALQQVVNQSVDYRRASTGWTAGSLAFIMEASPRHGFAEPAAVLLDLHRGECRNANALPVQDAMRAATFVIHGVYSAWMDVLSGRSNPLVMLTTGRLHLKKGSILRLLPYTRSATELVHCAQRVPWG